MAKIDPRNPYAGRNTNPYNKDFARHGGGDHLEISPKANSLQAAQDIQDKKAPGYDNDTQEKWLRGMGKPHPYFDYTKRK